MTWSSSYQTTSYIRGGKQSWFCIITENIPLYKIKYLFTQTQMKCSQYIPISKNPKWESSATYKKPSKNPRKHWGSQRGKMRNQRETIGKSIGNPGNQSGNHEELKN